MTYIYILEKDNIPFYVGKSKDTVRRKSVHRLTYGTDIILTIIDEVEDLDWKYWECYWIEQFKVWGFGLLNQNKGGGGPEFYSETSKVKMRKPRKEGTGNKISKTLKERNHSQYYTKEIREKISNGNKVKKPFSSEHKNNMSIAKKKNAKTVLMLDLNGVELREWESKGQAAEWLKSISGKNSNIQSQIKDCILGRQKTCFNYKWEYKL